MHYRLRKFVGTCQYPVEVAEAQVIGLAAVCGNILALDNSYIPGRECWFIVSIEFGNVYFQSNYGALGRWIAVNGHGWIPVAAAAGEWYGRPALPTTYIYVAHPDTESRSKLSVQLTLDDEKVIKKAIAEYVGM